MSDARRVVTAAAAAFGRCRRRVGTASETIVSAGCARFRRRRCFFRIAFFPRDSLRVACAVVVEQRRIIIITYTYNII